MNLSSDILRVNKFYKMDKEMRFTLVYNLERELTLLLRDYFFILFYKYEFPYFLNHLHSQRTHYKIGMQVTGKVKPQKVYALLPLVCV